LLIHHWRKDDRVSQPARDQVHRPEVWSSVAPGYDDAIAPIMRPYAITTLDLVGLSHCTDEVRLLDVAAGTGVVALEAARRGAEVLATDFAPGMVEVMRRRFAAEGLDTRAEVMDGQALSLHDQSFDIGTSTFGLIFFPDPLAGLRELRRVLRPGGRVGIASWDVTRIGLPQLMGAALARAVPDLPAPAPPPWAHLCEAVGLGQALRAAGFTDVTVHPVTHHWRLNDPALFFRQLPDWTPPLRPLFAHLPETAVDRAAAAFADVVRERSTSKGMPQAALIGIGARRRSDSAKTP
jgi:ubiquinone/menaquinone biosynthesis C-methylase UbiE